MRNEKLFEVLKKAYDDSTRSNNLFEKAINRINWDKTFEADGEKYFVKGGFILTIENIDPFMEAWKPSVLLMDEGGAILEF